MITEDYVSFETAKLLKEKGFCEECVGRYSVRTKEFHTDTTKKYNNGGLFMYAAPTIQMAMKWLREAYNLHISVSVGTDESSDADGKIVEEWSFWTYLIESTYGNVIYDAYAQFDPTEYQSYEEACEAAIKYCLENLI